MYYMYYKDCEISEKERKHAFICGKTLDKAKKTDYNINIIKNKETNMSKEKTKLKRSLKRLTLSDLQWLYGKEFGELLLFEAIESKYTKYDYIVRLENKDLKLNNFIK